MCGTSRLSDGTFVVLLFSAVLCGTSGGVAREPEGYNRADLVCVGRVDDTKTLQIDPTNRWDMLRSTTFTVTTVLKGDASMAERQIAVQWHVRSFGPVSPPYFRKKATYYVAALEEKGALFSPVLGSGGYEVTSRTVALPADAPLNEKVNLVLLATIRDCWNDPKRVTLALSGLEIEHASVDAPYYDLMEEYIRLKNHPDVYARCKALYARLRLGDETALPAAMDYATSEPWLSDRIPQALETFGDDALTTLCMIAEGRILPRVKQQAVEALRRMAPPAALPTLIKALDDPNRQIRYYAYTAIEKIRGVRFTTTTADFDGRAVDPYGVRIQRIDEPPPDDTHSNMLIDQMKQWWETEGKRQFDYVLPKEK